MELTTRVALVGSGRKGYELSSPWDCNVYAIMGDSATVLIDAGSGMSSDLIIEELTRHGIRSVEYIFITHSHADHAAGAMDLANALGAKVVAPPNSLDALQRGDREASAFDLAVAAGIYPGHMKYPRTDVSERANDSLMHDLGAVSLESIFSPGHSYDHTTYLLHDPAGALLFGGDLILSNGKILLQTLPDCRLDEYSCTIQNLAARSIRGLLPGHGFVDLEHGGEVLTAAARQFRTMIPPEHTL